MKVGEGVRQDIMTATKNIPAAQLKQLNPKERKVLNLVVQGKHISKNDKIILDELKGRLTEINQPKEWEEHHPKSSTLEKIQKKLGIIVSSEKLEKGIRKVHEKEAEKLDPINSDLEKEGRGVARLKEKATINGQSGKKELQVPKINSKLQPIDIVSRRRQISPKELRELFSNPAYKKEVYIQHPLTQLNQKEEKSKDELALLNEKAISEEKAAKIHKLTADIADQFDISKWEKSEQPIDIVSKRRQIISLVKKGNTKELRELFSDPAYKKEVYIQHALTQLNQKEKKSKDELALLKDLNKMKLISDLKGTKLPDEPIKIEPKTEHKDAMAGLMTVGSQTTINQYLIENKCFLEIYNLGKESDDNKELAIDALNFASDSQQLSEQERKQASYLLKKLV
jgi:hypothetical protein